MTDFFITPNLPNREVKAVIIGESFAELLRSALSARNVDVIACPRNHCVDPRLSSHADLSVYHMGGADFLLAEYLKDTDFSDRLKALGAKLCYSHVKQGREYPADAALCALNTGETVFHNNKISEPAIMGGAEDVAHVSQGYAKCAVCLVNARSAITADAGMSRALEKRGFETLLISPQGVSLSGFNEGFVGGAAFLFSPSLLAFTGSIDAHPDKERFIDFLQNRGVRQICLSDQPVFDIGSAIPIY